MSVGSIGSTGSISFWQQDQNYWSNAAAEAQTATASDSLITDMATLTTNETKGLASIANKTALDRVNSQLTSALKSAVQQSEGTSSSSSSSASAPTLPDTPATGTGTVPLTTGTSLLTLGISRNRHDHGQRRHQYDDIHVDRHRHGRRPDQRHQHQRTKKRASQRLHQRQRRPRHHGPE